MRMVRLGMFLYGISFLIAGAITLLITPNYLYSLVAIIGGIMMATYAYVDAEFK